MGAFLVDVSTDTADTFIFDRPMSSFNYPARQHSVKHLLGGERPLKIEALMAATAIPPTMMRPPIPKDPRGSLGGPPPTAPRCLIISRKLHQVNPCDIKKWGYLSMGLRADIVGSCGEMKTGLRRIFKNKLTKKRPQRGSTDGFSASPHSSNPDWINCPEVRELHHLTSQVKL